MAEACPKFKGIDKENEASKRGTAMHQASETFDYAGLTREETNAVHSYLDYIDTAKAEMPGCTELVEVRVSIDPQETTAGFLDRALISADETEAHVIDLKTGFGAVEDANNNLQGMAYAIGIRRLYPTLRRIRVSFVMPRQATFKSVHDFTAEQLDDCYTRIVAIVRKAKRAKYSAGFDLASPHTGVCRFCAHSNRCPKAAKPLSEFSKHQPIRVFTLEEMMAVDDPKTMGQVLDFIKFLDEVTKPAKDRITEIVKSGGEVEGYSLSCISEREIVDPDAVAQLGMGALMAQGLDAAKAEETVKDCYTLSLTALDSALSDAAPRGFKVKAKAAMKVAMREAGAITDATPKVFLKRSKDREALPTVTFNRSGGLFDSQNIPAAAAPMSIGTNGKNYMD